MRSDTESAFSPHWWTSSSGNKTSGASIWVRWFVQWIFCLNSTRWMKGCLWYSSCIASVLIVRSETFIKNTSSHTLTLETEHEFSILLNVAVTTYVKWYANISVPIRSQHYGLSVYISRVFNCNYCKLGVTLIWDLSLWARIAPGRVVNQNL